MATEQKAQTGAELFGRAMFDPSSRIYETVDPNYMMTVSGELASPDFQIKGYSGEDNIARAYGTTPPLPFGFAASVEVEIKVKDQGVGRKVGHVFLDRTADDGRTSQKAWVLATPSTVGSEPRGQFKTVRKSFIFPLSEHDPETVGRRFRVVVVCPKDTTGEGGYYVSLKDVKIIFRDTRASYPIPPSGGNTPVGASPAVPPEGNTPVGNTPIGGGPSVGAVGKVVGEPRPKWVVPVLIALAVVLFLAALFFAWRRARAWQKKVSSTYKRTNEAKRSERGHK